MKPAASQMLLRAALLAAALLAGPAQAAGSALPQRDLTVELRQLEEGSTGGAHYGAGSADASAWEPQLVQVRNGEKAMLRLNDALPMQWTQSASGPSPAPSQSAGSATGNTTNVNMIPASGVSNALVWFDAGQRIAVQPRWPGGNKPAVVVLEVQRAAMDAHAGAVLPRQTRNSVSTTITAPLAEWVTIAATGAVSKAGVYSSESGVQVRRLLQIRVMVP